MGQQGSESGRGYSQHRPNTPGYSYREWCSACGRAGDSSVDCRRSRLDVLRW